MPSQEDAAVLVAPHAPADPRECTTGLLLNQPGAPVALKIYPVLPTGHAAGRAALLAPRPL